MIKTVYASLSAVLGLSFFGACAPVGSDGKAERDGALNSAEVAVWIQSTTDEAGKYRVLFGVPNRVESLEVCKIPLGGVPANFVCDQNKEGYGKLSHLTNKSDRRIFIAEKLAIADKGGYAVYAKQGSQILWNGPRLAYFGKKSANPSASATPIQFTQVKSIMQTTCAGSTCHGALQPRDNFFADANAFALAKNKLLSRINSADAQFVMPRNKAFQGNDKQIMLDYLNQIR